MNAGFPFPLIPASGETLLNSYQTTINASGTCVLWDPLRSSSSTNYNVYRLNNGYFFNCFVYAYAYLNNKDTFNDNSILLHNNEIFVHKWLVFPRRTFTALQELAHTMFKHALHHSSLQYISFTCFLWWLLDPALHHIIQSDYSHNYRSFVRSTSSVPLLHSVRDGVA